MGKFWIQRSGAGAYAVAVGLALAATALHWLIAPWAGGRIPFLFYLPMLAIAAAYAGRGPALVVLLAGAVNGAALMQPGLRLDLPGDRVAIAAYLVVGLVLVLFGARVRLITRRAAEAEHRLRLAQDDTGIGLFEVDFASKTVSASASLVQLLGRAPTRSPMSLAQWTAMLPPDEVAKGSLYLKQKLAEGAEGYEREHRVELPGRRRALADVAHPHRARPRRPGAARARRIGRHHPAQGNRHAAAPHAGRAAPAGGRPAPSARGQQPPDRAAGAARSARPHPGRRPARCTSTGRGLVSLFDPRARSVS